MTTNEARAQLIVGGVIDRLTTDRSGVPVATRITQALADAGLLMPDLPEPKWPGFWEVDGLEINSVDKDGEVLIEYESDSEYIYGMQTRSLWLNRDQVIAILAAANYTEQEQDNV